MIPRRLMAYKLSLFIILTSLLSACSLLNDRTPTHQTHEYPQDTVVQVPDKAEEAPVEKTVKTTDIVAAENEKIAANLTNSAAQPSKPAVTPTATPATVVAVTAPSSVESTSLNGQAGLLLNMPYPQAWTQTKKALSQAGYPVMEQDNASGTYYILDKVGTGGVIKRDTPIYQLQLQKTSALQTTLILHDAQNKPLNAAITKRILGALQRQLSH